jgi:hypothetical protein
MFRKPVFYCIYKCVTIYFIVILSEAGSSASIAANAFLLGPSYTERKTTRAAWSLLYVFCRASTVSNVSILSSTKWARVVGVARGVMKVVGERGTILSIPAPTSTNLAPTLLATFISPTAQFLYGVARKFAAFLSRRG